MTTVGMIRLACFCGADLFYVGRSPKGLPISEVIQQLKEHLGPGDYGFFSKDDGKYGLCPFCGLSYELPDPDIMEWLPFLDKDQFETTVDELRQTTKSNANGKTHQVQDRRYLL